MNRKNLGEKLFTLFNYCFLTLLMIVCLYPMLYVLFASFSDPNRLMQHTGALFAPLGFTLEGYKLVLKNPDIRTGYINTLFYVTCGTTVNIVISVLSAYVLSRRAYWSQKLMFMVTFTMFFSGGMIPFYLSVKQLGIAGSRWALILPYAISTWNLIVMRTSFMAIPATLEEAARIDGAGDFRILLRIMIPLSIPMIAVMVLFYGVGHWNGWFSAMMFLRKREYYPLQLILREILIINASDSMVMMEDVEAVADTDMYRLLVQYCSIVVATVPILCLYPMMQKYFVKGVMVGAIKG